MPVAGLAQNRALAERLCYKYGGELNQDKTPIDLKMEHTHDVYTCAIENEDSLSIYDQTNRIISNDKTIKKTSDWKTVSLNKDYKSVSLEKNPEISLSLHIPLKTSDRFHIIVYGKLPHDEIYQKV